MDPVPPVLELRVALTTPDFERLQAFYVDGLGMEAERLAEGDDARAVMLHMGRATLELFDEGQAAAVDDIEVGSRVSGSVRLALRVRDLDAALERALAHGATLVHSPVVTPWGDRNARLQDPDGMQITLFQADDRQ